MKPRSVTIRPRTSRGQHYYVVTAVYPDGNQFSEETHMHVRQEDAFSEATIMQSQMKNLDWEVPNMEQEWTA